MRGRPRRSSNFFTNIMTAHEPVVIAFRTDAVLIEQPVAMIATAFPKERGVVADWVNGKDKTRMLVYVDELQAPEAITGKLNPENANPAFAGRDFVSALGEINAVEPSAVPATSPISNKINVAQFSTPANINYRGL